MESEVNTQEQVFVSKETTCGKTRYTAKQA